MTKVYVLTNNKGGVGKSTSATNIALGLTAALRQLGAARLKVLLVDTDSQAHATLVTTGSREHDNNLYGVLMADRDQATGLLQQTIVASQWDSDLHILPASPVLEQAERELMSIPGAPYRLTESLAKIAPHYGAIVIDTHPSFSLLTEMALVAATDAIVPVEPRYLETVGLLAVMSKIYAIREGWRVPSLHVGGILVTKMDKRVKGHRQLLDDLRNHQQLGKLVCGVIPMNEAVSYAHHAHQSVYNYDPKATASEAYARLVSRLSRRLVSGGAQ
ncbi:MAG: hypothetical protein CL607_21660 [Anaerolineaceae bacterium]|nr:hypothetical protein [Anaerolineaceae bacterium]MCA9881988.1 ParA family protein [Anaerolineae bacterium]MCA9888052.1 ParA family protein [Anaerolineae bacterium]MCA9891430.1 ParA family protein [Anaerolineae bacterium]